MEKLRLFQGGEKELIVDKAPFLDFSLSTRPGVAAEVRTRVVESGTREGEGARRVTGKVRQSYLRCAAAQFDDGLRPSVDFVFLRFSSSAAWGVFRVTVKLKVGPKASPLRLDS
jgi:hypothetical protein